MRQSVVGVAGFLLAAGCSSIFGLDRRSIILPISQVDAPSTVAPGASFNVTFTVQSGGCKRFVRLETTKTDRVLTAVARGTEPTGKNVLCTTDIRYDKVVEVVTQPITDPFSIVGKQPDGGEMTVQVRVQ